MKILLSKTKKDCSKCAGFGVFDFSKETIRLVKCKNCNSIHPETLGMRYEENKNNYHLYVIPSLIQRIFK